MGLDNKFGTFQSGDERGDRCHAEMAAEHDINPPGECNSQRSKGIHETPRPRSNLPNAARYDRLIGTMSRQNSDG
jgi:hypothetical protein